VSRVAPDTGCDRKCCNHYWDDHHVHGLYQHLQYAMYKALIAPAVPTFPALKPVFAALKTNRAEWGLDGVMYDATSAGGVAFITALYWLTRVRQ
jgi:hypothetical protein